MNRRQALVDAIDLRRIDIDADAVVPRLREAGTETIPT
jgi:hypothetical protein